MGMERISEETVFSDFLKFIKTSNDSVKDNVRSQEKRVRKVRTYTAPDVRYSFARISFSTKFFRVDQ